MFFKVIIAILIVCFFVFAVYGFVRDIKRAISVRKAKKALEENNKMEVNKDDCDSDRDH